ncbi:hypothetical protein [Bauldia sp.]|uniref:hypothetical protein n=1 Tax=Bauldia sp. TaxID=2575872 RepID=UPI003BAB93E1
MAGVNLLSSDPVLIALVEGAPPSVIDQLAADCEIWGSAVTLELARLVNARPPVLRPCDADGPTTIRARRPSPGYHARGEVLDRQDRVSVDR